MIDQTFIVLDDDYWKLLKWPSPITTINSIIRKIIRILRSGRSSQNIKTVLRGSSRSQDSNVGISARSQGKLFYPETWKRFQRSLILLISEISKIREFGEWVGEIIAITSGYSDWSYSSVWNWSITFGF